MVEEENAGRLTLGGLEAYLDLVVDVFSTRKDTRNGALFHMTQIVWYHIMNRHAGGPKIKGIELQRPAYQIINGVRRGKPYKREIDIVLEKNDGTERWIEVKSYKSPYNKITFASSLKKSGIYRAHFHDQRLNVGFINKENEALIFDLEDERFDWSTNTEFNWYFQKFKKKGTDIPPTSGDIRKAKNWLCSAPTAGADGTYFDDNLSVSKLQIANKCKKSRIELRNTTSYIKDLLKTFASQLSIEGFVKIIETLPD